MVRLSFLVISLFISSCSIVLAQNVKEIVRKADEKFRGVSSQSEMTMVIKRPTWSRTISMKSWTLGNDYSFYYISAPAIEKGQVFLKRINEMWNYLPSIERMMKIPPSMMLQSWMGSDFTNDDLIKESSLVNDYDHSLVGEEQLQGYDCHKILLAPKEDAPVVWGKIVMWISKQESLWLKGEYYDDEGILVNTEILSDVKQMDDRKLPVKLEMIPMNKPGQKTTLTFNRIKFNLQLDESFFSQGNMRKVR
jgi:outer membrane lipoprotein-sorting protein